MKRAMRCESGQATTELALMMNVILLFFFWAVQVNIDMFAYHQAAYASYMSARSLLVMHHHGDYPQAVTNAILTGDLFQKSKDGKVEYASGQRKDSLYGVTDGVTLTLHGMASLPYIRNITTNPGGCGGEGDCIMDFKSSVPTHLGPNTWDPMYGDQIRDQDQKPCIETDNNTNDSGC